MSYRSVNGENSFVHITKRGDCYDFHFETKNDSVKPSKMSIGKKLFDNIVRAIDAMEKENAGKVEEEKGE